MVDTPAMPPAVASLHCDAQVAQMLGPAGARIKARSIRSERQTERLVGIRIAGKWLSLRSNIAGFLKATIARRKAN